MGNSKSAVITTEAATVGSLCGGNVLYHHSLSARLRKKAELRIGVGPARAKLHFYLPMLPSAPTDPEQVLEAL